MKYGQYGVIDLSIYDEDGKFVTRLDTLKHSELFLKSENPSVVVQDSLIESDLLSFLGKEEYEDVSDFETDLQQKKSRRTIVFTQTKAKKCKLIGKGIMRRYNDMADVDFVFEIPNAEIDAGVNIRFNDSSTTKVDLVFKLQPFNKDGDLLKMHIAEEDLYTKFVNGIKKVETQYNAFTANISF